MGLGFEPRTFGSWRIGPTVWANKSTARLGSLLHVFVTRTGSNWGRGETKKVSSLFFAQDLDLVVKFDNEPSCWLLCCVVTCLPDQGASAATWRVRREQFESRFVLWLRVI